MACVTTPSRHGARRVMIQPSLGALVAEPVVQPVGLVVPEVDAIRLEAVAAPERRPGNVLALEAGLELDDALLEPVPIGIDLALG